MFLTLSSAAIRWVFLVMVILAPLCLIVFAYRGWAKRKQSELPSWRNLLGVTSIAVSVVSWFAFAYLVLALSTGNRTDFFTGAWLLAIGLASSGAIGLGVALKGRSRLLAVLAACLLSILWILTYFAGTDRAPLVR